MRSWHSTYDLPTRYCSVLLCCVVHSTVPKYLSSYNKQSSNQCTSEVSTCLLCTYLPTTCTTILYVDITETSYQRRCQRSGMVWCGKAKQSTINRSERQVKRGKKLSSFIQIVSSSTGDSLIQNAFLEKDRWMSQQYGGPSR